MVQLANNPQDANRWGGADSWDDYDNMNKMNPQQLAKGALDLAARNKALTEARGGHTRGGLRARGRREDLIEQLQQREKLSNNQI